METVGVIATVIVGLIVLSLVGIGVMSISDVRRYLKIRRM